jgi:serine/threonine protein kinase
VLGTAAYLAPEQGRGEEAGPPADIYALGVVTYQLLSGRLPFEGASLTELAIKQQREPPERLDDAGRRGQPAARRRRGRGAADRPAPALPDRGRDGARAR